MSHGIYAVANDTQLARTTLMRGLTIEPRADDIRPYEKPATLGVGAAISRPEKSHKNENVR